MIAIIICHKSLASELIRTAHAIVNFSDGLYALSNENRTSEALLEELEKLVQEKAPERKGVLLVDLRGGNTWSVARRFTRDNPGFFVLSGVNLPMIFSFLTKRNQYRLEELVQVMERDAHRGVVLEK